VTSTFMTSPPDTIDTVLFEGHEDKRLGPLSSHSREIPPVHLGKRDSCVTYQNVKIQRMQMTFFQVVL